MFALHGQYQPLHLVYSVHVAYPLPLDKLGDVATKVLEVDAVIRSVEAALKHRPNDSK